MDDLFSQQPANQTANIPSHIGELFTKYEQLLKQHRLDHPDLYRIVEERKTILLKKSNEITEAPLQIFTTPQVGKKLKLNQALESIFFKQNEQELLKFKIAENQKLIHEENITTQSI